MSIFESLLRDVLARNDAAGLGRRELALQPAPDSSWQVLTLWSNNDSRSLCQQSLAAARSPTRGHCINSTRWIIYSCLMPVSAYLPVDVNGWKSLKLLFEINIIRIYDFISIYVI